MTAFLYKNITPFILFGVKASVCVIEDRDMNKTAILTSNFS